MTPEHAARSWTASMGVCLLLACGGDAAHDSDAGVGFVGGSLTPPGCDYEVRTVTGAAAPEVAGGTVIGPSPGARHVHLGLAADPARSMVVGWRTGDDLTTDAELLFGSDEPDRSQAPLTWQYRDRGGPILRMYEAHLCGLEPDTEYVYQIRSGDTLTEPARFRTAPDLALHPDASVVIVALGDARGSPDVFGELLALADLTYTPDLILFTGDAVAYGSAQEQWDAFLEHGDPVLRRVPILLTLGNHEAGDQLFFTLWALPGDEHWFGLDYGPVHLTVLDDSTDLYPDTSGAGERFLRTDLAGAATHRWRFVVHHQPIYTAESLDGHAAAERLRDSWVPLFDEHEVALVIAGHNHRYERSRPMVRGAPTADGRGTTYLTTAGAGAPLYEAGTEDWLAATTSAYHFSVLRVSRRHVDVTAVDRAGNILDSFRLVR